MKKALFLILFLLCILLAVGGDYTVEPPQEVDCPIEPVAPPPPVALPSSVAPLPPQFNMGVFFQDYPIEPDCDDMAYFTWLALEKLGYECYGVYGNLELDNETFIDSSHVWIVADIEGILYYYEHGIPFLLNEWRIQHNEGYLISKEFLLQAMMADIVGQK